MLRVSRTWLVLVLGAFVLAAGCARSPEAKKARHLERGDRYFANAQYREALIEYANVLQLDGTNARATRQVALAHYQLGQLGQALRYLVKAQEQDPESSEVRLKLGSIYLLARRPAEARRQTAAVLAREPKNFAALLLWAAGAITLEEVDAAIQRLEGARADYGDKARLHVTLATLYVRKHELAKAERALQEAVAKDPKSSEAHTAFADFYVGKRDIAQAEREYRAAAALVPAGSPARLKLADFYVAVSKPEEAKRILAEMTEQVPELLAAWRRLADVALAERKYDESLKVLEVVLKKSPSDLDGLFLRGRVRLAKGEATAAIEDFQRVVKLEPRFAQAHYQLALAYLQTGSLQQAKAELREATTADPGLVDAALLQAELDIQTGAYQPAIEALETLIAKQAGEIRAYLLLGNAYLAKRDPVKAAEAYRKIVTLAPKDPRGAYLVGVALRAQKRNPEAKKEFGAALALAPSYVDPLAQLVEMALAEKQNDAALDRVKKQIALAPKTARLHVLLGSVHEARIEAGPAEIAYFKAIELDQHLAVAYLRLGSLYVASGQYDKALAKLNETLKINSKDLAALMLSAIIHQRKGEIRKAQEAYEEVLAQAPRFSEAANNLAWLYAEHGGDQDRALLLAQTAKEAAPEDPHISDTLGWILYKRGVYQRALALLQQAASKLPDSGEVQYHFGMASYKVGDRGQARKALISATGSSSSFPGKEEARKVLETLN